MKNQLNSGTDSTDSADSCLNFSNTLWLIGHESFLKKSTQQHVELQSFVNMQLEWIDAELKLSQLELKQKILLFWSHSS